MSDKPNRNNRSAGPIKHEHGFRQAGAIEYLSVVSPDGRVNAVGEGFGLIDYEEDLIDLRTHLAELNIGDISKMTLSEVDYAIGRALGVTPAKRDAGDLNASEAWVLINLAYIDFSLSETKSRDLTIKLATMLGRLVEWWRWRSEGHDRRAHGKYRSEKRLPKAREQLATNRGFDADWQEEARQEARELIRARRLRRYKT